MLGLPEAASAHAAEIDNLIIVIHYFMFVLAGIWGVFFLYCLFRFRASRNPTANYHGVTSNAGSYLEAGVVLFEAILLIGFAFPMWNKWVKDFPPPDEAEQVRVVAEQFAWNFHYPGPDGKFGQTSPHLIDIESNPLGLDRANDPAAADDIVTLNQLHLPLNKPALLFLTSKDVIHSFKVVHMRVTQDAIPGIQIPIAFTPTKVGEYDIACAQLCGIGHYRMKGYLTVDSPEDYEKWQSDQLAMLGDAGEEVW